VDKGTNGTFNAVGPGEPLTMGGMLEACKAASGSDARFTWVSNQYMKDAPGEPIDLPIWAPPEGETKGFHTWSAAKARQAGLEFRPVAETTKDTLAYWKSLPPERQAKMRAGLDPKREAELLAAWHKQQKGKPKGKKKL
jgi:2'-hydroxyisoflavone reductase